MSDILLSIFLACVLGGLFLLFQQQQQHNNNNNNTSNNKSSDNDNQLKQLQEAIRLLIETQSKQQYISPTPQAQPSFQRSTSLTTSNSATEVPVEIYQEVRTLQDAIKSLERKNRELHRQLTLTEVSNVVDIEQKYNLSTPGHTQTKLTASEIETIRAIFNLFDTTGSGTISTNEIKALHSKLGEPLTDEEAASAISELDQDGSGLVNFNKFLFWWSQAHSGAKRGSQYTARFKLIHAKLKETESFNTDKVITQDSGIPYTLEYRLNFYYKQENLGLKPISPWHDIPLYRVGGAQGAKGQIYNFVCEIPRFTRAKFECSTGENFNPIKQDTQHGKLRYYKHGDIMFNYGFFPQTWYILLSLRY